MPDDRPNILILMADQLKATALGLYGNRDVPTPNLERLAESGILYRRHYVAAPLCVPSRVAFWTGMYPHNTGVRHNQVLMPEDRVHYARLLSDAGYRMALIGKDHCFQGSDKDLFTTRMEAGPRRTGVDVGRQRRPRGCRISERPIVQRIGDSFRDYPVPARGLHVEPDRGENRGIPERERRLAGSPVLRVDLVSRSTPSARRARALRLRVPP